MFPSSRYFLGAFRRACIIFSGQNNLFSLANVKMVALRFLQKKREILYESTLIDFLLSCNQAVTCLNYKSGTVQRSARYFRDEFHTRISPLEFPCFQAKWIAFEIKKKCSSYKANRAWEILIAFFPQTHRRISAFSMSAREKKILLMSASVRLHLAGFHACAFLLWRSHEGEARGREGITPFSSRAALTKHTRKRSPINQKL